MMRGLLLAGAAAALLVIAACDKAHEHQAHVQPIAEHAFLEFDLQPLKSRDKAQLWIGTFQSGGKTAKFRMDFGPVETIPGKTPEDPQVQSGEGTILPEPGSDSSALLAQLAKVLHAQNVPPSPAGKTSVPFTYHRLGENLSPQATGGFTSNPSGGWNELKLIFGDGDRVSEILVYLNPSARKAQFRSKDPRFGDLALSELAKVL